ncbi:MAG TPA: hypothetical protein VKV39_18715 [Candidatus Sulfotelmatobacter sp.]|nr:hypothetical protein [Candidatus Sulfotelmatobacter sp.]
MSAYPFVSNQTLITSRMARSMSFLGLLMLLCMTAYSQQPETGEPVDRRTIQELLDRIASLEASDKQLRDRVAQLEKAQPGSASPAPALTQSPGPAPTFTAPALADNSSRQPAVAKADPQPTPQAEQSSMPEPDHMDVSKTAMNIRGFGDFGLYGGNQKGQTTSFSIGQMNLFITSDLSEHFKFLTELVFEVHQDNDFEEDLERIFLEYSANDYFNLAAGRYHTAIGYYNTAYHHATWFQTTTERPYIFEFEDEGGVLPIHTVGLEASGIIPSGGLGLHYVAEVGNGRSSKPLGEPVQNYVDENTHKAVNFALFARPDKIPGLQIGFSAYRDIQTPTNYPKINETIIDGYFVLSRPKFEWLNEALMIRHAPVGEHVFETPAFYSQFSQRFGKYRPYFRYQYVNASSQDPVFPQVGLRTGPSVGIRFDPSESVALKLQYDYTKLQRQGVIDGSSCPQLSMCAPSALAMQVDYKF